jgi:hypothetical protein
MVELNPGGIEELFHDPTGPVARIMERAAYAVENAAKRSILAPDKSGRTYTAWYWTRIPGAPRGTPGRLGQWGHRPAHTASAPGQAPASDVGRLLASIGHSMIQLPSGIGADIFAAVHYSLYLELGTRYMAARPFLRPALDAVRH